MTNFTYANKTHPNQMKKGLIYVLLLFCLGAFVCSCEGLETNGGGNNAIVGCWIWEEDALNSDVFDYFEFTKDGMVKEFCLRPYWGNGGTPATYKNGIVYTPASSEWKFNKSWEYSIKNGQVYIGGGPVGDASVKNDKMVLYGDGYLRVKQFKTAK